MTQKRASTEELAAYIALFGVTVAAWNTIPGPWTQWSEGKVVDKWWLTHIVWGYLGARMNQSFGQQMALTAANEVGEAWVRRYRPEWLFGAPETPANVAMDFVGNAIGWWLGRKA
jgi:hypothetical protein